MFDNCTILLLKKFQMNKVWSENVKILSCILNFQYGRGGGGSGCDEVGVGGYTCPGKEEYVG